MKTTTNVKALLLTFCAVGVLTAANQTWADSTVTNCAQVTATTETDVDSQPNSVASQAALLAAFTGGTLQDDESCAPLTVQSIFDFGDAPDSYGTKLAGNGAQHEIIPGLMLGATVDDEADGQSGVNADGDGTDEDGVTVPTLTDGQAVTLQITATNTLAQDAHVGCWIDYDHNGTFDTAEYGGATVPAGSNAASISVTMPSAPADASTVMPDGTYARCRLSTDTMDASKAVGLMSNGEIEDYKVTFTAAPVFDLALNKRLATGQATTAKPDEAVVFTIEVINQGTVDATDVAVTDYIPTGLVLNDAAWTDNGNGTATLKTPIATLAAGTSTTVNIAFKVATDAVKGEISNAAEISSAKDGTGAAATDKDSTPDNNPGNETGIVDDVLDNSGNDEDDHDIAKMTIMVDPKVDIELVKTVTDSAGAPVTAVRRGADVVYVLTATNKGPDAATGVVVKDQLPAGLTYKSDDSAGGYDSATGAWTVGDMGNGESKVLKITATVK
ncbi:DUF11 domain-containing protein [Candidatus Thiothrix sp. Deng01]|uniref:DUF11 domain-containing protein n=1 Tax=Candidatus Thiothrix phosphatis TaxID=3112415 RepID=A0ABU6D2V5_9GAMM|nr:DUF11 domain-containing protein [Candidatus Thiothrix sp. Deng01]MEB4593382.1 DUF11 domain-containing protein [Candidatus Thiothrix sp. Deng01]